MMHPWHDIPTGDDAPHQVNAVVEVPARSTVKYALDKHLGIMRVSYVLYPPVPYPGNYGFIPRTLDDDGDPLDMIVVMREPVAPMSVCAVRPIGVVDMKDRGEIDAKVLCVMLDDPVYAPYEDFAALPDYEQHKLQWFFEEYQRTTYDDLEVGPIEDRAAAEATIGRCMAQYEREHGAGRN